MAGIEHRSHGIVLKKHTPRRHKLSILDAQFGRIEAILNGRMMRVPMVHGALIEYGLTLRNDSYFINEIQLVNTPTYTSQFSMLFFHHALEMVYYSVPLGAQAPDVLVALESVIALLPERGEQDVWQKIIMAKLFVLFGEGDPRFERLITHPAIHGPVVLTDTPVDREFEDHLDRWLYHCITNHPCVGMFKTIHFLTGSNEHE